MKTSAPPLLRASAIGLGLLLTGCSSLPKDSLVRGLKIGGTPWSPTIDAEVIATGLAAKNLTAEERAEILQGRKN